MRYLDTFLTYIGLPKLKGESKTDHSSGLQIASKGEADRKLGPYVDRRWEYHPTGLESIDAEEEDCH